MSAYEDPDRYFLKLLCAFFWGGGVQVMTLISEGMPGFFFFVNTLLYVNSISPEHPPHHHHPNTRRSPNDKSYICLSSLMMFSNDVDLSTHGYAFVSWGGATFSNATCKSTLIFLNIKLCYSFRVSTAFVMCLSGF